MTFDLYPRIEQAVEGKGEMKPLIWVGAVLVLLGLLGLAIPGFTTSRTEEVAKLGDFKVQTKESDTHVIPRVLSIGVLALGGVLILTGATKKLYWLYREEQLTVRRRGRRKRGLRDRAPMLLPQIFNQRCHSTLLRHSQ